MIKLSKFIVFLLLCFVSTANAQVAKALRQGMVKEQPARTFHADTLFNKANTVENTVANGDDNESYNFFEGQLGENEDFPGTTAMISSDDDYFLSNAGFRFGAMLFRARAYESKYNNVYANGVLLNDAERGRLSYDMIGGLDDATRNKEGATYSGYNNFGISSIGGAININMRASQYAAGHKASLAGCNRNYLARVMYTGSTGLMQNGWAFTGSASYRWANEGVIEGTFYNSAAYFLAAEKKFNNSHSLSIATWGSPTERAQQGAATEEAYRLAGSHYYNPYWGYEQGKKRNARVVNSYEPAILITWDYDINNKLKLTTTVLGKYSMYSTTVLGWNGNAADPRPNNYQNMPSAAYDIWDLDYTPTDDEIADYHTRHKYWTSDKANRQLSWDYMHNANQQANETGDECLYYVERRHNDQFTLNLGSSLNIDFDRYNKGIVGLQLGTSKGMHYKTMDDLLSADKYTDIDNFSVSDFGINSDYVQNDVDNPNRQIGEGDIFGYNYDLNVNKATLFYQHLFTKDIFNIFWSAHLEGTTMERYGHMRNGRAQEHSKGSSGTAGFFGGGARLGMEFTFDANNTLSIGGGYENRAPLAYNSFIAPRMRNDFVTELTNEDILSAEISYKLNAGPVSAKISGYGTIINNSIEHNAFHNERQPQFTYLTMTGVCKAHYGLEAAIVYNITSSLSINAIASVGEAKYTDNAKGFLIGESETVITNGKVYMKGVKQGGTPLTAASLGIDYNIKGWYLSANVNYYDRIYINASKYVRLASVDGAPEIDKATGEKRLNIPEQYKGKGGFIVDASIGKSISLRHDKRLNLNLQLCNLLNNRELITGGYEQNRVDGYTDGGERTYKFSKNPYLYYTNPFNFYLNIGFYF